MEASIKFYGDSTGTTILGIQSSIGPLFPGLSNSFHIYERTAWFRKNRYILFFVAITTMQLAAAITGVTIAMQTDRRLDAIALSIDLGDITTKTVSGPSTEYDEIFGNEFVKDKTIVDPNTEDPRIAGAENPYAASASLPVDLNPEILPEYTAAARAAAAQGTVTLEIIISEEGKLLRVRSVGRSLGYGLEDSAIRAYQSKKFRPSLREGQPITVKYLQPVRFQLMN